ncbi:MAG: hypothetical protein GXP33_06835 [Spirochaetes bacterium]|nr:hypothetical protein [Spirochaetota bacterium]
MILVYDIGTTSVKGAVFNVKGEILSHAASPVRLKTGANPLINECDPNAWLSAIGIINTQLEVKKIDSIRAIVVSGNGPTLVPVGKSGEPVSFAATWLDRRGIEESKLISEITGNYVDPSFFLPKAYWFYRNNRELYNKTAYFMPCPDFINYSFTGEAFAVLPSGAFKKYMWNHDEVEKLRMDSAKFPEYIKPGEIIGKVRKEAEDRFGVPAGIPVFGGGPDFIMSLLGTATVVPGRACDRSGTSEGINLCSEKPVNDGRLLSLPHIIENLHNISGIISTSGKALEWFKTITGKKNLDYETLFEELCEVPPGCRRLIFLPYLAGERSPIWDPDARGTFVGLTLNHGRREMTRAVVESVGFAIRDVLEIMEENDFIINDLRVTGGQSKSPLWNQIKADITGKRILLPDCTDSELKGNACVALKSLKVYKTFLESAEKTFRIRKVYEPQQKLKELYDELFTIYRGSYRGLKPVFKKISQVTFEEGKWQSENL